MPYASFTQDERHFSPSGMSSLGLPLSGYFQSQEHTQLRGSGDITPCKQGVFLVTRNHSEKVFGKLIYINWASQLVRVVKNPPAKAGGRRDTDPWVRKIPWRRAWQPTPVFLPGESHGQRGTWRATVHGPQRVKHDGNGLAHTHIHTNHSVGPFFGCQFDLGSFRRIFFDVDLLDVSR